MTDSSVGVIRSFGEKGPSRRGWRKISGSFDYGLRPALRMTTAGELPQA